MSSAGPLDVVPIMVSILVLVDLCGVGTCTAGIGATKALSGGGGVESAVPFRNALSRSAALSLFSV